MVLCERFLLTVPDCVCAGPLMSCVAVLFCSFFVYLYIVAFPPLIIRKCANVKNALNENTTDKNISFSFLDNASVFSFCHLAYSAMLMFNRLYEEKKIQRACAIISCWHSIAVLFFVFVFVFRILFDSRRICVPCDDFIFAYDSITPSINFYMRYV